MDSYTLRAAPSTSITRHSDGATIPPDTANEDYQQFLTDWKAGATVQNADGSAAPYTGP